MELRDDDFMIDEDYATWTAYAHGADIPAHPATQARWRLFTMPRPGMLITHLFGLVKPLEPTPAAPRS